MNISIYISSLLLGVLFCKTVNGNDIQDVIKELSLRLSESQVSYNIANEQLSLHY